MFTPLQMLGIPDWLPRRPKAALRGTASAYVEFAKANPALYDAMFTLATDLPFGRPEAPAQLYDAFDEIRRLSNHWQEAVTPKP
jgi:hypothetical protein